MKVRPIGPADIPPGTYYFPEGARGGNGARGNVDNNGLIPVYFRPKNADSPQPEETGDAGDEDMDDPILRFSSREKWKKKRLMGKLHSRR